MNPWVATSEALPREGDAVLFVVERRNVMLRGTYAACTFKSRWSCYSPGHVCEWRKLDVQPSGSVYNEPPTGLAGQVAARGA